MYLICKGEKPRVAICGYCREPRKRRAPGQYTRDRKEWVCQDCSLRVIGDVIGRYIDDSSGVDIPRDFLKFATDLWMNGLMVAVTEVDRHHGRLGPKAV